MNIHQTRAKAESALIEAEKLTARAVGPNCPLDVRASLSSVADLQVRIAQGWTALLTVNEEAQDAS